MVPVGGGWVTLSIPGQGTKLPQALWLKKKKERKKASGAEERTDWKNWN